MRLAALYSGGKDSTFAMYVAEQMGHSVETMVNIRPNKESWIFHVPNQNVIPAIADAMGKRLVTADTNGSEEDDMEALRAVLKGIDVDGIVTGAVWSDYQWDRINRVCDELGLIVLSPLWRKDQDMVMNEMMDSGIITMIIGVYAEGLGEEWLGRILDREAFDELIRIREEHSISVIGEGGEFETLTIDSPMQSSSLKITEYEKEWNGIAGTMHVRSFEMIPKDQS